MTAAVYASSAPEVLAAYQAGVDRREAYATRLCDLREQWGFPRDHPIWTRGTYLLGLDAKIDPIPPGWRLNKNHHLIPNRRTSIGKAVDPVWQKVRRGVSSRAPMAKVGMPIRLFIGDWLCEARFVLHDGAVWVSWGHDPESDARRSRSPADEIGEQWRRVPLSEYYALVEAGNDPFATRPEPTEAAS